VFGAVASNEDGPRAAGQPNAERSELEGSRKVKEIRRGWRVGSDWNAVALGERSICPFANAWTDRQSCFGTCFGLHCVGTS
jgi:hypothetical protein